MDLNASPQPEEDREVHEERIRKRQRLGHSSYASHSTITDEMYQLRKHRYHKPPPDWLDCPPLGKEIGCIIPSKVPLDESYNDSVCPAKRYSFTEMIQAMSVLSKKLGMVIDLTNTDRYYLKSKLEKEGIKHVKIACWGRDSVPDNESVNLFVYEVSKFLAQHHSKQFVLVHCTHGHNRTGYMIVHYLMRSLPIISVTQALKIFADARSPGIYKPYYIDALYSFYHEKKPDMVACPTIPEWKRSIELENGDAQPGDDDDGDSVALSRVHQDTEAVMKNDDILGDSVPSGQQDTFRRFCYQTLKLTAGASAQFPGSHPVSLDRENVKLLRQRYYYSTWKADGTRYMMLITTDGCYLIDRHFSFRRVQMRFPCRHTSERTHHLTLLDGEMIIDTVPGSQKQERRYLIYDMMALNSLSIVERPFYERWKIIEKEIIEPRNYERQHIYQSRNPYYRYELEPFRVRRKDFWVLSTVAKLLKEFIPNLSHDADGLVFQGWDDPYVPRTNEGLLKWKYANMNSVDFLFEVEGSHHSLYLYERGKKKLMEGNTIIFPDGSDPLSYSGKIIECSKEPDKNVWACMRVRPDKGTPNHINTYHKVLKSIKDNITEEILLNEINETIQLPMYADRIQKDSRPHQAHRT